MPGESGCRRFESHRYCSLVVGDPSLESRLQGIVSAVLLSSRKDSHHLGGIACGQQRWPPDPGLGGLAVH